MVYESSKVQKILIGLGDYLFKSIGTVMIMKYGSSKMQKKCSKMQGDYLFNFIFIDIALCKFYFYPVIECGETLDVMLC